MKTRNELYNGEGAELLRFITTYHTLLYEQVLRLFPKNRDSIKSLITSLVKQGRIIHDKENDLLCDTAESASNPDYGMIAAFWVILDFKKAVVYHTSGDFPIKLNFFSKDEWYEILYIPLEQEYLINHVMESQSADQVKRLVVLENEGQARKVTIDNVVFLYSPVVLIKVTGSSAPELQNTFAVPSSTSKLQVIEISFPASRFIEVPPKRYSVLEKFL